MQRTEPGKTGVRCPWDQKEAGQVLFRQEQLSGSPLSDWRPEPLCPVPALSFRKIRNGNPRLGSRHCRAFPFSAPLLSGLTFPFSALSALLCTAGQRKDAGFPEGGAGSLLRGRSERSQKAVHGRSWPDSAMYRFGFPVPPFIGTAPGFTAFSGNPAQEQRISPSLSLLRPGLPPPSEADPGCLPPYCSEG